MYTDLQINIWALETISKNYHKKEFYVKYYPSRSIYLREIDKCNDFIQKYAYKISTVDSWEKLIELIIKILKESFESDTRLDILFNRIDIAHKSDERLNDSTGLFILQKKSYSFNRELNETEIMNLKREITNYYDKLWYS